MGMLSNDPPQFCFSYLRKYLLEDRQIAELQRPNAIVKEVTLKDTGPRKKNSGEEEPSWKVSNQLDAETFFHPKIVNTALNFLLISEVLSHMSAYS